MLYKGLFIIQLVWVSSMALSCSESAKREVFSCASENLNNVKVYGMDFTCPEATLCNAYHLSSTATTCSPCLAIAKMCGDDVFKCIGDASFTIGDTKLTCPKDHICNKNRENSCAPCIGNCNPDLWQCIPDDESKVIIGGMTIPCNAGEVCNKDKKPPCTACIPKPASFLDKYMKNIPEWNINDVL